MRIFMKARTGLNTLAELPGLLLLLGLVMAVYIAGLGGDFVIDDQTYFIDNDLLPELQPWSFAGIFLRASNYWGELLPVRDFFYVIQYQFFADSPFGYHLVSLLLYLLVVVIAWRLVAEICKLDDAGVPCFFPLFFALAFFALHPIHVESVAYISGQKDLLCALFSFSSILVALRLLNTHRFDSEGRHFTLFVTCYYAAFLSKNLAVATGLVISFLGVLCLLRNRKRWRLFVFGWFAINLPVLLWLRYSLSISKNVWKGMDTLVVLSFGERLVRGVRIMGEHFFLLVWPERLSFGYPFEPLGRFDVSFWCGFVGILLLFLLIVRSRSWNVRLGAVLIIGYLLPISQVFYDLHNAAIYDRYLFVPVLGAGMLLGEGLSRLSLKRSLQRPLLGLAFVVLFMLGFKTAYYIPAYRSNVAVAENAYALFPDWNATSFNLAVVLVEVADFERVRILLDSEPALSYPTWVPDYLLGWMSLEEGQEAKAVSSLRRSFLLAMNGGYFPYAALPLARGYRSMGNDLQALRVIESVMNSRIYNPLDYYRARKLREEILGDVQKAEFGS
jgi:hypothetical protein